MLYCNTNISQRKFFCLWWNNTVMWNQHSYCSTILAAFVWVWSYCSLSNSDKFLRAAAAASIRRPSQHESKSKSAQVPLGLQSSFLTHKWAEMCNVLEKSIIILQLFHIGCPLELKETQTTVLLSECSAVTWDVKHVPHGDICPQWHLYY